MRQCVRNVSLETRKQSFVQCYLLWLSLITTYGFLGTPLIMIIRSELGIIMILFKYRNWNGKKYCTTRNICSYESHFPNGLTYCWTCSPRDRFQWHSWNQQIFANIIKIIVILYHIKTQKLYFYHNFSTQTPHIKYWNVFSLQNLSHIEVAFAFSVILLEIDTWSLAQNISFWHNEFMGTLHYSKIYGR